MVNIYWEDVKEVIFLTLEFIVKEKKYVVGQNNFI